MDFRAELKKDEESKTPKADLGVNLLHPAGDKIPLETAEPAAPVPTPVPNPAVAPVPEPAPAALAQPAPIQTAAAAGYNTLPQVKQRNLLVPIALVALILVLGGGGGFAYLNYQQAQEPEIVAQPEEPVTAEPATAEQTPVSPTALPAPAELSQKTADGNAIGAAATVNTSSFTFSFTATPESGKSVTPEIEVSQTGSFTGSPTHSGSAVTGTGSKVAFSVSAAGLKDGTYRWQARLKDDTGASSWTTFGATGTDFAVDTTKPATPAVTTVNGQPVSGASATISSGTVQLTGTAEPGSKITAGVSGQSEKVTAQADQQGVWSVSLLKELLAGTYSLTITSADAAGNEASSTLSLTIGASSAPAEADTLAPTGDNTLIPSLLSLLVMVVSLLSFLMARRYARS